MKKLLLLTVVSLIFISAKAQTNANVRAVLSDTNKVYAEVPVEPQFPGGINALNQFISDNLKKVEQGVTGVVFVSVIVEKDGTLTQIKSLRAPSEKLSAEALRVIRLSPKWAPGLVNGKPVRVAYTIPVGFK